MVKAYFCDEAAPQCGEHMWVSEVEYDGETITGVLADTPQELRSVQSGGVRGGADFHLAKTFSVVT